MRHRVLTVEMGGPVDNIVRGPGAFELIRRATGRPATYISTRRGYSCQESTARNVIAFAEQLGYDVVITGTRASRSSRSTTDRGDRGTQPPDDTQVFAEPGQLW